MASKEVIIHVPEALAEELRDANQAFLLELLTRGLHAVQMERALNAYARGGMSFAAAAERAGVSRSEFAQYAYAHGVEPPFSSQTVAEELA